jgi:NodT family efflux transporter outer membrane factor (OMF) lipoprotein
MHKILSYSYIFLLALFLLACSAGRNYKRPELNAPGAFQGNAKVDSSIALMPWKSFFADTTLQHLIDRALTNNFNIQIAVRRIESAEALVKRARAAWLPAWNAQIAASTNNPSENSLNGISLKNFLGVSHLEDYTLNTGISWELDIWGKIRRQRQAAEADYLQTFEAGRAVRTSIVAQVANGYYNLLMIDAQLAIARQNVALSDSIVQMIRLQKEAGDVTELAVQQAVSQQQNAALLVPQLEQAIVLQENALRFLLGDWPGSIPRTATIESAVTTSSLSVGVPADLLRHRPDVRSSELALRASNARVGVAQASMYPSLTLTATGGINAYKASNWFTVPASLFGTATGGLLQPIFQRRTLRTQLETAKIEREQRVVEFRQSVTNAVHEVTNALTKIDKLQQQKLIATDRVSVSEKAVFNAQLLFKSGLANYLEVISAQSRALQAELDKAAITRQHLSAQIELYQSLGGGWQ